MRGRSQWMFGLIFFGALIVALSPRPSEGQSQCYGGFAGGKGDPARIEAEVNPAVFQVFVDGKPNGTAYLVDAEHGFFLTALHVVRERLPIVLVSSTGKRVSVKLKYISQNAVEDVAVIIADDPQMVAGINSVDISLGMPSFTDDVVSIGYPNVGKTMLRFQRGSISSFDQTHFDVNEANSVHGASGSPLLDEHSASIGTAVENYGPDAALSRYQTMQATEDILAKLQMSAKMNVIDEKIRTRAIDDQTLGQFLIKRSGNPSNLDLFLWGIRVANHLDDYRNNPLFDCPIAEALAQRELIPTVRMVSSLFSMPAVQASAHMVQADEFIRQGFYRDAKVEAQQALDAYARTGQQTPDQRWAGYLLAKAEFELGDIPAARQQLALAKLSKQQSGVALERLASATLLRAQIESREVI